MQERKRKVVKRKAFIIRMTVLALPLVLLLVLAQTAFAENTYVITDGDRVLVHTSSATDPAAVLDEAGLALGADDTYTTQPGLGVSEITVQRHQSITVQNGKETVTATSRGETVSELLSRLNIPIEENTTVSSGLDEDTYDGMKLVVSHTVRTQETYSVSIDYQTTYCYDATLPEGSQKILTPGQNGQMLCTADVIYLDGEEASRSVILQTVTVQPVNEIIAVGTGGEELEPGYVSQEPIIGDGFIVTPTGEVLTYTDMIVCTGTGYSRDGKLRYTYSGTIVDIGSVAVDPDVIPLGTRMYIISADGEYVYGVATAEDIGAGVEGAWVDLYFGTTDECWAFGMRPCNVYILGETEIERQDIKR